MTAIRFLMLKLFLAAVTKKTGNKRFRQHERKNRLGFVYCRFQQQTNKLTLIFDEIATLQLSPKGPYFFFSRFVFGLNKLS